MSAPLALSWSSRSYGPDGPWNAVSVGIGTPPQDIDLYPGGRWSSTILLSSLCANTSLSTKCYADDAGVFDPSQSHTHGNITDPRWQRNDLFAVPGYGQASIQYDTVHLGHDLSVPNVSLTGVHQTTQTYPDGTEYPVSVGWLSLGAPRLDHVYGATTMTFVPGYLYRNHTTPSYSYGLHIGSAAPQTSIPGSLLLGGYDRSRVLGPVSAQPFIPYTENRPGGKLTITLDDLSLAVATGGSPWASFHSKTGLLSHSNASLSLNASLHVDVDPTKPYLYLPKPVCDVLAANLPVTFDSKYGLYLWNTSDPLYAPLVTSPAYLGFTFRLNGAVNPGKTFPVNVPFALLNLTLEEPLTTTPTVYFPCMPSAKRYTLGRAFLQAAFLGVNYGEGSGEGTWFLAQAPGPSFSNPSPVAIGVGDTELTTNIKITTPTTGTSTTSTSTSSDADTNSDTEWMASWSNNWTPLPDYIPAGAPGVVPLPDGPPLSPGAIAGIAVGFGVALFLAAVEIYWICVLRRRKKRLQTQGQLQAGQGQEQGDDAWWRKEFFYAHLGPRSHRTPVLVSDDRVAINQGCWNRAELGDGGGRWELEETVRWELEGSLTHLEGTENKKGNEDIEERKEERTE